MLDHFQMGPNLVRGFAPNGIGPRDLTTRSDDRDALGGTKYWGASAEVQMPFWFLPKEVGLKGAVYADAGSLWDYKGPTSWAATGEVTIAAKLELHQGLAAGAFPLSPGTCTGLVYDDGNQVRTSVGVGLIWASPFGPLRFDYAVPLTKGQYDRVQQFKFGGGTSLLERHRGPLFPGLACEGSTDGQAWRQSQATPSADEAIPAQFHEPSICGKPQLAQIRHADLAVDGGRTEQEPRQPALPR